MRVIQLSNGIALCLVFMFTSIALAKVPIAKRREAMSLNLACQSDRGGTACSKLKDACESNNGQACLYIGLQLVEDNQIDRALALFERACSLGSEMGCEKHGRFEHHMAGNDDFDFQPATKRGTVVVPPTAIQQDQDATIRALQNLNDAWNKPKQQNNQQSCTTRPFYGPDGRILRYDTECQ